MQCLTAAEMRAVETEAIETGRVTGLQLMERAGQGMVSAIFELWPTLARAGAPEGGASSSRSPNISEPGEGAESRKAVVLCGPGNNGGDGFVVSRLLHQKGWEVNAFLFGNPERMPPDARANYVRWRDCGEVGRIPDDIDADEDWQDAALVIDAMFGTGLTRPLEDLPDVLTRLSTLANAFERKGMGPRVVAVDIPSGLHTDTGQILNPSHGGPGAARANLTVTFHAAKCGHERGMGPEVCGRLVVSDIGL